MSWIGSFQMNFRKNWCADSLRPKWIFASTRHSAQKLRSKQAFLAVLKAKNGQTAQKPRSKEKCKKSRKKLLTNQNHCGIMRKLSLRTAKNKKQRTLITEQHDQPWTILRISSEEQKPSKVWIFKSQQAMRIQETNISIWEFDPGSGWTLAACLSHASRTKQIEIFGRISDWVADGWVTRG